MSEAEYNGNEIAMPVRYSDGGMVHDEYGLTKREYFAGLAMQGLSSILGIENVKIVEIAVDLADKLLIRLEETK